MKPPHILGKIIKGGKVISAILIFEFLCRACRYLTFSSITVATDLSAILKFQINQIQVRRIFDLISKSFLLLISKNHLHRPVEFSNNINLYTPTETLCKFLCFQDIRSIALSSLHIFNYGKTDMGRGSFQYFKILLVIVGNLALIKLTDQFNRVFQLIVSGGDI